MLYFQNIVAVAVAVAAAAAAVVLSLPLFRVYSHTVSYHHIIIVMSNE